MVPSKLATTFMVIRPDLGCVGVPVTPSLYGDLDAAFAGFHRCLLVAEHTFAEDWATWERHPHGDELLYLLEGACELHLWSEGTEEVVPFREPGTVVRIPRGTWHTAKVQAPCRILFLTPGEGTTNERDPREAGAGPPSP